MRSMVCLGCRKKISPITPKEFHLIDDAANVLCEQCYAQMTGGSEAFGSPLCCRVLQGNAALLLLPGNRVQLAQEVRMWTYDLARMAVKKWRR